MWVINDYFITQFEKQNMNCITVVVNPVRITFENIYWEKDPLLVICGPNNPLLSPFKKGKPLILT